MSARESWNAEMESVVLYRAIVDHERSAERRELFTRLAGEAEAQAAIWAEQCEREGTAPPTPFVPTRRVRLVAALVRKLGAPRLRGVLAAMKVRGMSVYSSPSPREPSPAAAPGKGHAMPRSVDEIG